MQSEAHAVALARAEVAWDAAARLRACPPPLAPESAAAPAGRVRALFTGTRAGVVLVAASLLAGLATVSIKKLTAVDRYATMVGQQRMLTLTDGSRIRLNTATTVEVAMHGGERDVHVLGGEALFEAAPDIRRPFRVRANGGLVTALGARFNLRVRRELVELTVTRGTVAVRDGDSPVQHVAAGDGAALRDGLVARTALNEAVVLQRTAWTQGVIDLTGVSLGQAVEEFNRYRLRPVVIGDPRLAALSVAGRYPASRSDLFVTEVEQRFPVRAVAVGDGSVLLVGRDRDQQG